MAGGAWGTRSQGLLLSTLPMSVPFAKQVVSGWPASAGAEL